MASGPSKQDAVGGGDVLAAAAAAAGVLGTGGMGRSPKNHIRRQLSQQRRRGIFDRRPIFLGFRRPSKREGILLSGSKRGGEARRVGTARRAGFPYVESRRIESISRRQNSTQGSF